MHNMAKHLGTAYEIIVNKNYLCTESTTPMTNHGHSNGLPQNNVTPSGQQTTLGNGTIPTAPAGNKQ